MHNYVVDLKQKKGDAGPIFGCETAVQFISATDLSHWLLQ